MKGRASVKLVRPSPPAICEAWLFMVATATAWELSPRSFDKRTGQVTCIVLTTGGFLDWARAFTRFRGRACRYVEQQGSYIVAIDRRVMEGASSYRPASAPIFDDANGGRVTDYWLPPDTSPADFRSSERP